jgi:hypothetical protein
VRYILSSGAMLCHPRGTFEPNLPRIFPSVAASPLAGVVQRALFGALWRAVLLAAVPVATNKEQPPAIIPRALAFPLRLDHASSGRADSSVGLPIRVCDNASADDVVPRTSSARGFGVTAPDPHLQTSSRPATYRTTERPASP